MKTSSGIALLIFFVVTTNLQAAGSFCGELKPSGQYGPYDYSNAGHRNQHLRIVEQHHFTKDVENLIRGETGYLGQDIDYTLSFTDN